MKSTLTQPKTQPEAALVLTAEWVGKLKLRDSISCIACMGYDRVHVDYLSLHIKLFTALKVTIDADDNT